jgi:excinuclease ABC subunit A
LAIKRRYKPAYFSFNVEGGRCENCKGDGTITVEMQFMADVHLKCEECNGNRFKEEVLEVVYRDKNIFDILELTVDDAIAFFKTDEHIACKRIVEKLLPLQNVGLGYLKLGQSNSTLSGGEAQRIKLASFLTKGNTSDKTLFIFDEPTTGLHFHDIEKLLSAFTALIGNGHSIIVVEHNLEIIKSADWIIDLGPDGGENGGAIVCFGTPEYVASSNAGFTSHFLKEKLEQDLLFAQK